MTSHFETAQKHWALKRVVVHLCIKFKTCPFCHVCQCKNVHFNVAHSFVFIHAVCRTPSLTVMSFVDIKVNMHGCTVCIDKLIKKQRNVVWQWSVFMLLYQCGVISRIKTHILADYCIKYLFVNIVSTLDCTFCQMEVLSLRTTMALSAWLSVQPTFWTAC